MKGKFETLRYNPTVIESWKRGILQITRTISRKGAPPEIFLK